MNANDIISITARCLLSAIAYNSWLLNSCGWKPKLIPQSITSNVCKFILRTNTQFTLKPLYKL
jgi:hypothetical protein